MDWANRPEKRDFCDVCGKPLTTRQKNRRQRFCSRDCYNVATGSRPVEEHICKHCGKVFKPSGNDRTTYCSRECAFADKAKKCKTCGKVITGNQSNYCSDKCKEKAINQEIRCIVCGKAFRGRIGAKYCSDECRKEKERQRQLERDKARSLANKKPVVCKECGKEFIPEYGSKRRKFCSDACLKKYTKRQYIQNHPEQRREQMRRRRARLRGVKVEKINPIEIYERDGWRCQICGKRVNPNLKYPHPMSATLDHIIPLAEGGTHEPKNLQLAHFICNSKKGAKGYSQLRLF